MERTEDALSDAEEKSLKGEMHDLELRRAKRSEYSLISKNPAIEPQPTLYTYICVHMYIRTYIHTYVRTFV